MTKQMSISKRHNSSSEKQFKVLISRNYKNCFFSNQNLSNYHTFDFLLKYIQFTRIIRSLQIPLFIAVI